MIRDDFQLVPQLEFGSQGQVMNQAVFVKHATQPDVGRILDQAVAAGGADSFSAGLQCQCFGAAVQHDPLSGRHTDHACKHGCGAAAVIVDCSALRDVHKNVGAGTDFADSWQYFRMHQGRSGTDTDGVDVRSQVSDQLGGPQGAVLTVQAKPAAVFAALCFVGMALMRKDSLERYVCLRLNVFDKPD